MRAHRIGLVVSVRDSLRGGGVDNGGVILRAHRFRAAIFEYRLERGHYMDGEHDRADRWYVVLTSRPVSAAADRSGRGFRTIEAAADEAEQLLSQ